LLAIKKIAELMLEFKAAPASNVFARVKKKETPVSQQLRTRIGREEQDCTQAMSRLH
jgi:hypothetical protein